VSIYIHDPNAVLDYAVDWASWLPDGDSITSHSLAVESGDVVKDSDGIAGAVVTAWISGGTNGTDATVRYRVTTAQGRTDDRTIYLKVRSR
jgi:hypothetical protein